MDGWDTVFAKLLFREGKFYLCILPLCIVSPLVFLALNTQSGHCVGDRLVVDSCLASGICLWRLAAISTWYAAVVVSICLGCVYLLTYPSQIMRRLFCSNEFWYLWRWFVARWCDCCTCCVGYWSLWGDGVLNSNILLDWWPLLKLGFESFVR